MARIVVVDDSVDARHTLKGMLGYGGYTPVIYSSGQVALEAEGDFSSVDLIISDVMMEMPAEELMAELAAQSVTVPIILVTGDLGTSRTTRLAEDPRVKALVYKPFDLTDFLDTVESVLQG